MDSDYEAEDQKSTTRASEDSLFGRFIFGDAFSIETTNEKFQYVKNNHSNIVSLYLTFWDSSNKNEKIHQKDLLKLQQYIAELKLDDVTDTEYGLILNVHNPDLVNEILKLDLSSIMGKEVRVAPLYTTYFKKILSINNIPWCIRDAEIETCLKKQGINFDCLLRETSTLYLEVCDLVSFQKLRQEGVNFYDSVIFRTVDDASLNEEVQHNTDNVIQCYKCLAFGHTAIYCKNQFRCGRCGEQHQIKRCNRPRNSPICLHCRGPHHAFYKLCPERRKFCI